jgi:predicted RNase H-like HicB family nuclease
MDYIAYLHKDRDSDFGVSFPDFPGCIAAGKTLEEARVMAVEALAIHIAGMVEDDEAIPEASTLDSLAGDEAMEGAVAFLVHVEPQTSRTVRVNITAREKQIEEIDRLAEVAGMTRSAYMVQSALSPSAVVGRPILNRSSREKRARELSQQVHRQFQNQGASVTTRQKKKA